MAPSMRITTGPCPDSSNAILVPSLDVTCGMASLRSSVDSPSGRNSSLAPGSLTTPHDRPRYVAMARGANPGVMTINQTADLTTGPATGPPSMRPRVASTMAVIGLTLTTASSQPGSDSAGTKTELVKVRGRTIMNPQVFTDSGLLAVTPRKAIGQHIVTPNATTSR